ncbi:hypothetical protein B5M47_04045 [candidate division CPR3 bacterium 4484_211]|uniref:Uncharacterized protein n=1 Tax=candidate division CPR3 bacterium 4484_211 TaxID=1968527 RepID=A0A1W9NW17_UNCC3|nr:MAG: hypothetical protein B5M47_04045 [candidate division CPR3 bacterium 4484_211]
MLSLGCSFRRTATQRGTYFLSGSPFLLAGIVKYFSYIFFSLPLYIILHQNKIKVKRKMKKNEKKFSEHFHYHFKLYTIYRHPIFYFPEAA